MGIRPGSRISLTIACAFVDGHVADLDAYVQHKAHVREIALGAGRRVTPSAVDVAISGQAAPESDRPAVEQIIALETSRVSDLTDALVHGRLPVFRQ